MSIKLKDFLKVCNCEYKIYGFVNPSKYDDCIIVDVCTDDIVDFTDGYCTTMVSILSITVDGDI